MDRAMPVRRRLLASLVAVSVALAASGAVANPQFEWLQLDRIGECGLDIDHIRQQR